MAGDITPATVGMQTGGGFIGVSIQKSYQKLQPQKNIRPTGERSFRLDRPSRVDIVVNGQTVRRLQMPPGDHDISELPLKAGENALTLEITDDTGQHRTLKFTVFFDHTLLASGVSEWGLAAGYRSIASPGGILYSLSNPAATGYYQLGITEDLTATAHAQANFQTSVAGLMAVTPTWLGRFSVETDGSVTVDGVYGLATALFYTPDTLFKTWNLPGVIQLSSDYRSAGFTPLYAANGSLGESFSLNGFYSIALPDDFTVALSGNVATGSALSSAKLGGGLTVSKTIEPDIDGSLSLSYNSAPVGSENASAERWSILGRVTWKPSKGNEVSFTQDSLSRKSVVGLASEGQASDGHYAVKADIERDLATSSGGNQDQVDFSANYSGSRFDVSASRSRQFFGSNYGIVSDVSTVSAGGAVAFADDHIAVGRPVTDSFAIVVPHDPNDATSLRVPGETYPRAQSDRFGPALVSDLASYSHSAFPVEAEDAPAGYDLGTGVFDVRPDYKSGYVLKVGSDYGVTAVGSLEADGKPLALLSGLAKEEGVSNPRKVVVFTNKAGQFCAEGLKAGTWRVEMIGDPPKCFRLTLPEGASGIFDAGAPAEGCSK